MNPLKFLFGIVAGGFLGAALGFGVAAGIGIYSQWQNPADPSAGSVAIIGIFTVPVGLFVGVLIGAIYGVRSM